MSGVAAGVLARGEDVWFACIPDLWRLPAAPVEAGRKTPDGPVPRERLLTGFGVHIAFGGHDLHGLIKGPDGRLYFSIADRGSWVTNREDRVIALPDTGAVFRCEPDGSRLEVVARGLRNPQELAFDDAGNLWTGDNNGDGGDKARWTLVLEGADYGWTIGWQWLPKMGAWNAERLWHTRGGNTAASIVPPVAHIGHGPAGIAHYPGTGLGPRFRDHFLMADFPGGIRAFRVEPDGAFFRVVPPEGVEGAGWMEDNSAANPVGKVLWDLYPVDVAFPPFGGMIVADWVRGWEKTGQGRLWHVVDPAGPDAAAVAEVRTLLATGMGGLSRKGVAALLGHPDQRVRLEAQWDLAGRGPGAIDEFRDVALDAAADPLARRHALWGIGQIVRGHPDRDFVRDLERLLVLLQDDDLEVRVGVARLFGESGLTVAHPGLLELIAGHPPRVAAQALLAYRDLFRGFEPGQTGRQLRYRIPLRERLAAAVPGMFQHRLPIIRPAGMVEWPVGAITRRLDAPDGADPVLRHAAATALAQVGRVALGSGPGSFRQNSGGMPGHENPNVRLAWLLAERELADPRVESFLADAHPVLVLEAARAIHDVPIPDALPALAARIAPGALDGVEWPEEGAATPPFTPEEWRTWVLRRAANAAFRLGGEEQALALADMAARDEVPVEVRREALEALANWAEPPARDRVVGLHRPLTPRPPEPARAALTRHWDRLAGVVTPGPVVRAALDAATRLGVEGIPDTLVRLATHPDPEVRAEVTRRREAGEVVALEELLRRLGDPATGPARQQAALADLAGRPGAEASTALGAWMDRLLAGSVPPALQLDVLNAAARRDEPALRERLDRYRSSLPSDDPLAPYRVTLAGGDPVRGRHLFAGRADWGCQRCHKLDGEGGDVGPDLAGIGSRRTVEYLLESIVVPNRQMAPGYETVILTLDDGRFVSGTIAGETADTVTLNTAEDGRVAIPSRTIVERERGLSAMPEGLVELMTLDELRDVLAALGADGR